MMNRQANETLGAFITRLREASVDAATGGAIVREALTSPTELADTIHTASSQRQIPLLTYILGFLFDAKDSAMVPALCEIVTTGDENLGLEDAVEILGEIGDTAAVPCLTQMLIDPPGWDFQGYVGEKAVKALAKIAADRARSAIAVAATSPRRRVWQASIQLAIAQHDTRLLLFLAKRLVTEDPWSHHLVAVLPAVAQVGSPDAWRIIDEAAEIDDDDNRAIAMQLRQMRGDE